ncbi:MAG: site-specific DNA-methyltransferase [Proteobacteria bacterium]|nr:site-specific DNA-methyltransferase [Pseudomonadota bacterium]
MQTQFVMRNVNDLIPYARNARTHSPEQIAKLAGSIKEFGFLSPVVISADGGILAGHGRVMAAQKLGLAEIPCIMENHLTETQRRAFLLADNRLALDAGWDNDMLALELKDLADLNFDLNMLGFTEDELSALQNIGDDLPDIPTDDEPVTVEDTPNPVTQPGDVWLLGEHRLICGDCTDTETVRRLFGNDTPNLMVTDPPYGINYEPNETGGRTGKVLNDDRADWREAYALFPGNVAYVWHAALYSDVIFDGLRSCGFTLNSLIVWNKSQFVLGRGDYHWKHEPCVYATRGKHNWQGDRTQTTVWDIPNILHLDEGEWGHGTQKPIECMKRPMENNSEPGEYVYDPFCGSGTSFIAAERTKRRCLGCELSPVYCDTIVRRWQMETGKKATRQSDGALFDDLKTAAESPRDSLDA